MQSIEVIAIIYLTKNGLKLNFRVKKQAIPHGMILGVNHLESKKVGLPEFAWMS